MFTRAGLEAVARRASLARGRAAAIHGEVVEAVSAWPRVAAEVGVSPGRIEAIGATHRLAW